MVIKNHRRNEEIILTQISSVQKLPEGFSYIQSWLHKMLVINSPDLRKGERHKIVLTL